MGYAIGEFSSITGINIYTLRYKEMAAIRKPLENTSDIRPNFEIFKSNICHCVKDMGDIYFLIDVIKSDKILSYLDRRWYREALYLLAMVDYLCRENGFLLHEDYAELRLLKLSNVVYPAGILVLCAALKSDEPKEESLREAIPEFLRHNIVESEVRSVA